ncbi:MAG TPA: FG-GAP repeat protein [Spirochaetales bacterium]|nr:FG-GAP repeat protein [Spirochaetales bacterium]HRY53141.1 FG-GAP repeat protein [Spirochaetia bacterium]HRZ63318.1 FG-GAP repeat protein [Spirochaetia bacterium]
MGKLAWSILAAAVLCCFGCAGGSSEGDPELDPRFLTELSATGLASGDSFGSSVAIDGDYAIVGCPYEDAGGLGDSGAAYVYERSGSGWVQVAKLSASDAAAYAYFGSSVGISGEYAIVGAYYASTETVSNCGAAYIFERSEGTWAQAAKLLASEGAPGDSFGRSVAIDGDRAMIGAPYEDAGELGDCGAAYVYERSGSGWVQAVKLSASDAAPGACFGSSGCIGGEYAIVGAPYMDTETVSNCGAAYVFSRSGETWAQAAKLTADDAGADDNLGSSVAIAGNRALVGASWADASAEIEDAGAAYVFERSGAAWPQKAKLRASDAAGYDRFGCSVALRGGCALVGAPKIKSAYTGGAYLFVLSDGAWSQLLKLTAAGGGEADDWYGYSVALSEEGGIIGVPRALDASEARTGGAELWSLY